MSTQIRHGHFHCPDVLGDKWTLLIIREVLSGTTRFMDFPPVPKLPRTLLSEYSQG
jgi:DNA-binding HxlR family transcriptional regulator